MYIKGRRRHSEANVVTVIKTDRPSFFFLDSLWGCFCREYGI
jgi:hypothetical protein